VRLRSRSLHLSTRRALLAGVGAALLLTGCGAAGGDTAASDPAADSDGSVSGETHDADGFPVTVTNCDREVTFQQPPERILVLGRAELVSIISELDEMDRIVGRAGAYPPAYYDDETNAAIADIPSLSEDLDESGHHQRAGGCRGRTPDPDVRHRRRRAARRRVGSRPPGPPSTCWSISSSRSQ
jgi:hypothetical protein